MTHATILPMCPRCEQGFTLVEILIAVAIVSLLLAFGVPAYQDYFRRAENADAIADIKSISVVLDDYRRDKKSLPATLDAIRMGGLRDPWGNPYQYLNILTAKGKGKVRKDHNLVPLNTDYDLYSMGPDGASVSPLTAKASRDDIVRANDGRFVGLASDY